MSYEMFRTAIASRLHDRLPVKLLHDVLQQIDEVASKYEIRRTCTDIILVSDEPEMVKMYLTSLAIANKAKSTLNDYRMHLKRFFSHIKKPFNVVTTNDIRKYLFEYQIESGLAKSSLDHVRTVVNAFYSWCVNQEIMERNPVKLVDKIKVPKKILPPLEQIDLEQMRGACKTPREKALIDVLYSTGMRVSEAAALKLNNINWKDRSMVVMHGKGDKQRVTYFNPEAEVSIKNYLESRNCESEYLFCKSRAPHTGVTRESLEREMRHIRSRVSDKLSVLPTPHTLRRTTATTASDRGMPIEDIQALLGHESIDTTKHYITVTQNRVQTNYNRFMAG